MTAKSGFSLIELLIVIVIVGILASLTLPAFSGYMERTRRTDAITALVEIAARQEALRIQLNAYTADFELLGFPGAVSERGYYAFDFPVAPGTSVFTIRAQAVAGAAQDDDLDCQWFTIDHLGRKASGPSDGCWVG